MTDSGTTPLYRAARNGSIEAVQALLDAGGQINIVTWDTWTPLHEAVEMDHAHMVTYLLSNGADTTIRTVSHLSLKPDGVAISESSRHLQGISQRNGQTPLEMAVFLGREKIRKILESVQDEAVEGGSTMLPVRSRKRDVAPSLLEQDVDGNKRQHIR